MDINKKIKDMNSLKDLKEIAKEVTKLEFLKKVINHNNTCPKSVNLEDCGDHGICSTTPCYSCWENAIKDIKFKGESYVEFNWNEFKKGKIVVHCETEKEAADFLNKCNFNNIKWVDESPTNQIQGYNNSCYRFVDYGLAYGDSEYYEKHEQYKIVEWQIEKGENGMDIDITPAAGKAENMLNELTTNKYDREYNILEIKEFPEETEFVNEDIYVVKFKDGILQVKNKTKNTLDSWSKCRITREWLNAKFKLVKKDKKVSFEEAIQAYGKTVYCIWRDKNDKMLKTFYEIKSNVSEIFDTNDSVMCSEEILNGGWYIKED